MNQETIQQRIYAVRLALGDGWKTPMPGDAFASLLAKRLGKRFDGAMVSRMENGAREVRIDEAKAIAALDPLKRGPGWLAFGESPRVVSNPATADRLSDDELDRADDEATQTRSRKRPHRKAK